MPKSLSPSQIKFEDIERAHARIVKMVNKTPIIENRTLNLLSESRLLIKPEMLQITGSFKFRGACNAIVKAVNESNQNGVIAYSSGNHAQGIAAAAHKLGIKAVVVMPEDAPQLKRYGTESWGAEVITYDRKGGESREEKARAIAKERGLRLVRPYDDPDVIAGQGTVGLEIVNQIKKMNVTPDVILIPCGGGGLTAGTAIAMKEAFPNIEVHPVEPVNFDDTTCSLAAGKRLPNKDMAATSICDALLAEKPGRKTFPINKSLCSLGLTVTDEETLNGMLQTYNHLKLVAEPGGAIALSAALHGKIGLTGKIAVIVMSGGNVDPTIFNQIFAK